MDPLITIETVPIKIEYSRNESTHTDSMQSAKLNISKNDNSVLIQSDPISISADTFEFSPSVDWNNLTYTATAQYSGSGNLTMNVQLQGASDNAYQYQQFGRGIDNIIHYFPSENNDSSQQSENMQINFDMSQFLGSNSGSTDSVDTSFYPPDLEFKVVERPKVIIKYVGGPIYVPPSADPEYDASKAVGITYFPESSDPNYDSETSMAEGKSRLDLRA